ncbi:uncharacterized protein C8A04DRAFT_30723 [Dichotomopilus funicola]|uniref:Uncharacterized protein n=1 Tax=Dichotomopilus funicola TaxID=1934379 RepID=A0AAN6UZ72_9PEZI|nr:hypothetical protein C8A04DRAFT_30723 [Dichotomopilus funicola]
MARARYPAPYALLHLVLRFLSMGLCIATLACASYASSRGYGVGMIGAFIAIILTTLLDLSEVSALLDPRRHVRRLSEPTLLYLELLATALCGILPVMCLMAYLGLKPPGGFESCGPVGVLDHAEGRSLAVRDGSGSGSRSGPGSGPGSGTGSGWVCEGGEERMKGVLAEVQEMNVYLFLAWVLPLGLV